MKAVSFSRLHGVLKTCAACVLIASTFAASAQLLPAVNSSAASFGSDTVPPVIQSTTSVAGEIVSQSATASAYLHNSPDGPVLVGSVGGSSSAATDFGINRVGVGGGLIGIAEPGAFAFAYTSGQSFSRWNDSWTVGGGTMGELLTVSLSGRTTYELSLAGGAIDPRALQIGQGFNAGGSQLSWSSDDFFANAAAGYIDWVLSFDARSGDEVQVAMYFQASLDGGSLGLDLGTTNKGIAFDAMHTSLLESISLPIGYSLTAESGQLVAHDGGFAYRAVLAELANEGTVAEPQTLALAALGLFATGLASRRRSRQ